MGKKVIINGEEHEVKLQKKLHSDGSDSGEMEETPFKLICEESGVPFACEEGNCGTCVIEVKKGNECLSTFCEQEEDFLGEFDPDMGERLACQCKMVKDGEVEVTF